MKKIIIAFFFIFSSFDSFAMVPVEDTSTSEKYGWMIFIDDEIIIWVPSDINVKIKLKNFFKTTDYSDGLDSRGFLEATKYREISKSYNVFFGTRKRAGRISIVPVKALTHKSSSNEQSEVLEWYVIKNKSEIHIKYRFAALYYISDVLLIRKCDKRKLRKLSLKYPSN